MGMRFLFGVAEMFLNLVVVMVAQTCKCTKNHSIVHFKWVHSVVGELYLNESVKKCRCLAASPKVSDLVGLGFIVGIGVLEALRQPKLRTTGLTAVVAHLQGSTLFGWVRKGCPCSSQCLEDRQVTRTFLSVTAS